MRANILKMKQQPVDDLLDIGQVFERYHQRLFSIAYRITLSRTDATDVVQDVFVRLAGKIDQFMGEAQLSTWLYRITVNSSIDFMRFFYRHRHRTQGDLPESLETRLSDGQFNLYVNSELSRKINCALKKLPPSFRAIIVLRDFEEMSYKHISEILGISSGTVASRLSRGYGRLRRELKKLGVDESYLENR